MAETPEPLDFYLDVDDTYEPEQLPTGTVKMGGTEYRVHCPKDSLPMLLSRIQNRTTAGELPLEEQERLIRDLVAAVFEPDDADHIMERVISPYEPTFSIAFLVHTVERVYHAYAPLMDEQYEELGMQNPVKKPQDRLPPASKKQNQPKTAPARKTKAPAKKTTKASARRSPATQA